ncbi:restriction endonuclease subunit S [Robertmurraya massiliosenegalensis]|uniref:restriction endonuclease subunit S n=1 Tax=Robertmurraya TaxID=2837507 RepID=UPI0039A56B1D
MIRYRLGEIVDVISEREDNPSNCKYDKFVGLEHYISGEVEIKNYGNTDLLKSAMKVFKAGDILVARRNVYLRRASVVNFDGITSGDSIVLRAKDELIMKLLPFVLNTDNFWEYAEKFADGTMSKRLSPKILLEYEFVLPEIKEQEKLVKLLWTAEDTKEAYKNLLNLTDDLVKAQFFEIFGNLEFNDYNWPALKLSDACADPDHIKCGPFGTQLSKSEYVESGVAIWGIPQINSAFAQQPTDFVTPEKAKQLAAFSLQPGDIAMSRKGNVGMCALFSDKYPDGIIHSDVLRIRADQNRFNPVFLMYQLRISPFVETQISMVSAGAIMAGINVTKLKNIMIHMPPIELQNQFVIFVQHVEKSKFDLNQTISSIENTIKSLIEQFRLN